MFVFIRAINTGGRRLTNDELLAPFRVAGLDQVEAYQAAGNVTFVSDRTTDELAHELRERLSAAYGFEAPVFLRTVDELTTRTAMSPFPADELAASEGRVQITFMADQPTATQIGEVLTLVPSEDTVTFVGREWFWLPRAGVSASSLPVSRIEQIVGPMTMRTLGTVERMLRRFGD